MSGTPQLRSLTLHILAFPRRQSYLGSPPQPGERIVLVALTRLKYRGTSKYLDVFVARIEAPRLGDIEITLFSQPTMDALQLGQFIQRTEIHASLTGGRADVEISAHAISISFTKGLFLGPFPNFSPNFSPNHSPHLRLQISCKQLDWQLSCMAQICDQISPFLFHVGGLRINAAQLQDEQVDVDGEQWVDLLRSFKFDAGKIFWVDGELTADILCTLGPANEGNTAMLPSLRRVRVQKSIEMDGPSWNSLQSFITSRSISGRPVQVDALFYRCHICHHIFAKQHELKHHLSDKHRYQILCSYCGVFECTPGHGDLFLEHLKSGHYQIVHNDLDNDSLFSTPSLTPFQFHILVDEHSSLRAPDVVPLSPTD